ncbi:MAG: tetratricopeptide repeat protein [Myxococcales bacterium]|nr:tetratricopeptide repeat protein [Myxococcales bacterium]MBK7194567.1 tetratricopeptide repeat protein [Myxococcales bacterium]
MSVVPTEIPEVGATSLRLRQNPRFDPMKAGFGTEEYFVWSRFDGATSVKDLILMTGLAIDRAVAIVRELRRRGAILAPGETEPPTFAAAPATATGRVPAPSSPTATAATSSGRVTAPMPAVTVPTASGTRTTAPMAAVPTAPPVPPAAPLAAGTAPARTDDRRVATPLPSLDDATAAERAMIADAIDLSLDEKTRILAGLRLVAAGDPWALVGVPSGSDKKVIKRAFFERSKLFHPDRYYGRQLGPWAQRLHAVFDAISAAHADLIEGRRPRPASQQPDAAATAPQSPVEYAAELFDRACQAEVSGDLASAGKLFAAATKLDSSARYLRRAASCALAAGEPRTALDYAKKAAAAEPADPSTARTLAKVLRALDKLDDAEEVLVMALAMKNENDTLGAELAGDLSAVRAALRSAQRR